MNPSIDGLLVIDKPSGITSRSAVDRAQTWFPKRTRIGHTGTLDPLASGVLVLCIGNATRLTEYVQQMPKIYAAGITLGATSDTDDADGTITRTLSCETPAREPIELALQGFLGAIEQVPPAYSAAKVAGRRAYDLARKGHDVELQPRTVSIRRIDIVRYDYPRLEIVVHCGKGTYIRSLARDLGQVLGCGGYIDVLRRRAVGSFTEAEAIPVEADAALARARVLPVWRAVQDSPPVRISAEDVAKLRTGGRIALSHGMPSSGDFAVAAQSGEVVAVVKVIDGMLQPLKVFAKA